MNPPDITTLLNMSESEALDFKSGQYKFWNPATDDEKSELLKDIIALANSFKTGDSFIVIGVAEKNQQKDQVVGVATHLRDNDVQQFVNSKTNRKIAFLVHSTTAEGQPIDIIQVAHKQERPICLTKSFGKVKANEVWVRVGSSSAIATPDQIVAMARADQNTILGETRIVLEWAEPKTRTRLGAEVTLTGTRFVIRPPAVPGITPISLTPLERTLAQLNPLEQFMRPAPPGSFSMNLGPSADELMEYYQIRALACPIRIWLKNLGAKNAANVNVKIVLPKVDGLTLYDDWSFPKKPRGEFDLFGNVSRMPVHTHLTKTASEWIVEVSAKTIQPQDEFWSLDDIYITTLSDQTLDAAVTIFADDLAKPIEVALKIHTRLIEREFSAADFEAHDD